MKGILKLSFNILLISKLETDKMWRMTFLMQA
jgi:hypothetical protein